MAKILNPREPVWFTPPDQLIHDPKDPERFLIPEDARVQYQLKVPSHWDEINLDKALGVRNAKRHGTLGQLRILRAGVAAAFDAQLFDEQQYAEFLAQIDAVYASHEEFGKACADKAFNLETPAGLEEFKVAWAVQSELLGSLNELTDLIRTGYPAINKALADDAAYPKIVGMESARIFVVGWRNIDVECKRDAYGLRADLLDVIPMAHIVAIGEEVERLLKPTETETKNSDSPSLTA